MDWIFRTLIIAAQDQALAQDISVTLAGQSGDNMWITPLSADGQPPATHYISTGYCGPEYAAMMPCATWEMDEDGNWVQTAYVPGNAALVTAAYNQAKPDTPITEQQVEDIYARADVSDQEPFTAQQRMGLQMVQVDIDA
jgi:hypothetical protein